MSQEELKPLFGAYKSYEETAEVVHKLLGSGVPEACISLVMSGRAHDLIPKVRTVAPEGAIGGGSVGALVGGLVAIATLAVPGGILAVGPLATLLAGGAAGAAGGGFIGALLGFGVEEPQAKRYAQEVLEHGYVIAVNPTSSDMAENVETIFRATRAVPLETGEETLPAKLTSPLNDVL